MGRRVLANGKAVATTTSQHTARAILPDMRLMGQVPVPRKNWIDSEHLAANRTTNTKFDDGWVWKQDTKCGEPPLSKGMPDDHLPGLVNGGFVDGCAEALEGQGAPTVYVEGLKAICKDHITWQNHRNTIGMIVNAEDLAAYLAEPMPGAGEQQPADRVGTEKLATTTGDAGEDEDAREKDDDGNNVTTTPDATPTCTLESFQIIDLGGEKNRLNSSRYVLEVVGGSRVKLLARGSFCGDHARLDYGGIKHVGTEKVFTTSDRGVARLSLLHRWYKEVQVICDAHGKQITGTVFVCSSAEWELEVGQNDNSTAPMVQERGRNWVSRKTLNLREKVKPEFKKLERRLPFKVPFADFKYLEGSVLFAAKWEEQDDWQAWCEYSATGKMLIVDAFLTWEVKVVEWLLTRVGGPVGLAIATLFDVIEWALDVDLEILKLEIKFGGKLETEAKGAALVDRSGECRQSTIQLLGKVEIYLHATLKLAFTPKVEGSVGGKGSIAVEATGGLKFGASSALDFKLAFKGFTLKWHAGLKIKLGWIGRFIPDWVVTKVKYHLEAEIDDEKGERQLKVEKELTLVDGWMQFDICKFDISI